MGQRNTFARRGRAQRRPAAGALTAAAVAGRLGDVSLLLPQTRTGTVRDARPVDIHGDRYVDLLLSLDGAEEAPVAARVAALECPSDLRPGERVSVRFTMGVATRVTRAGAPGGSGVQPG